MKPFWRGFLSVFDLFGTTYRDSPRQTAEYARTDEEAQLMDWLALAGDHRVVLERTIKASQNLELKKLMQRNLKILKEDINKREKLLRDIRKNR